MLAGEEFSGVSASKVAGTTRAIWAEVLVPPGIPIARYVPGSAADLKVGAKIFVAAAAKQADGTLVAPNVAVGRDIDPPQ